jgi:predicted CXXCH cytochrome family protein
MGLRKGALVVLLAAALPAAAVAAVAPPADTFHLKAGARGALCLSCHTDFQDTVKRPFVHTPVKSGACTVCHDPHASSHGKLLAENAGAICASCHGRLVPEKARSVHAPVAAGQCVRCHDPHASKNRANLIAAGNDLCAACHAGTAKSASEVKFKHPPAEKNCLGCHDPHASAKSEFLLRKEVPALCADCHRTDQPVFAKQHMNYPVAKARCTSCHDPHGSNTGGVLWATIHPPVINKMCNQCHQEASSPGALGLKKIGFELCRGCHSALVNDALSKNRLHWPAVDRVGCLNCHNPHASAQKALLKVPTKLLCGRCHADTIARQEKSVAKHQPIDEGNCVACHSPHASDNVFLLKGPNVVGLCGTCHNWKEHSSHPIGERAIDPRNKNLALDCLSCHRSHGSPFKSFASFDTTADLCLQCHQNVRR